MGLFSKKKDKNKVEPSRDDDGYSDDGYSESRKHGMD